jgi:hypothetical protein
VFPRQASWCSSMVTSKTRHNGAPLAQTQSQHCRFGVRVRMRVRMRV